MHPDLNRPIFIWVFMVFTCCTVCSFRRLDTVWRLIMNYHLNSKYTYSLLKQKFYSILSEGIFSTQHTISVKSPNV